MKKAFCAIVTGLVQGVSFRYHTCKAAWPLDISGFVRNLPDGTVEVYAEGDEKALAELASWLEKGPSYARVEKVDISPCAPKGDFSDFSIR